MVKSIYSAEVLVEEDGVIKKVKKEDFWNFPIEEGYRWVAKDGYIFRKTKLEDIFNDA